MKYDGVYHLPIGVKPSGTLLASYYWYMRNNTSGKRMFIRQIHIQGEHENNDVTLSGAAQCRFYKFSGGTPGGVDVTLSAGKNDSNMPSSNLLSAGIDTGGGFTMTGVTVDTLNFISFFMEPQEQGKVFRLIMDEPECIVLNPGEGLIFYAAMSGAANMNGFISWGERD